MEILNFLNTFIFQETTLEVVLHLEEQKFCFFHYVGLKKAKMHILKWASFVFGLGKHTPSKTDEFSEKFQTAFDPPPSFSENHIADFL